MEIPILGNEGRILGWTDIVPELRGGALRHSEAERLIGGAISCLYVQIDDKAHLERAGAPHGWSGPWRCLALCGAHAGNAIPGAGNGGAKPLVSI